MQDSLEDTERTSTNSSAIGELDTSPVATELPAILRVDGSEYQIDADSTPDISEESAESIEAEVPCMYCDFPHGFCPTACSISGVPSYLANVTCYQR